MQIIVIEGGFGDAAKKLYLPALKSYLNKEVRKIYLVDIKTCPLGIISENEQGYVIALNKNVEQEEYRRLQSITDIVFIATPPDRHLSVARTWLGKKTKICIEKPASDDVGRLKAFLSDLEKYTDTKVYFFDHYKVKFNKLIEDEQIQKAIGDFTRFDTINFIFIDPQTIEESGREEAFISGVIFDLLSHFFAILVFLHPPCNVKFEKGGGISGRYDGVTILEDTLGLVKGIWQSTTNKKIEFTSLVGMAVNLDGLTKNTNIKAIEFSTDNSHYKYESVLIKLGTSELEVSFQSQHDYQLFTIRVNPYEELMEVLIMNRETKGFFLEWNEARQLVEYLEEAHRESNKRVFDYSIGDDVLKLGEKGIIVPISIDKLELFSANL